MQNDSLDVKVLATDLEFPEGPVAMNDGSVVLVEIAGRALKRIDANGTVTVLAQLGGGPNGLAIGPDGAYYVCNNGGNEYRKGHTGTIGPAKDYAGGYIQRFDPRTGEVRVLYTHCGANRLNAPNDIVFDVRGGFYFTDFGKRHARYRDHGGIYYAQPDGSSIKEVAFPLLTPNGIGFSPDGSTLYVAETETSRVWAYEVIAPGELVKQGFPSPNGGRLVCGLPGFQRFDSLAVDALGNICVATLMTGHITVIAADGRVLRQVRVPDPYPTNICFGGPDMRTAYITLSGVGQLVVARWPEPGLRLNCNA
ncbi:MAG: SMP-30/gluconolactonase/LRE family protein [Sulfuricaulis sp.]|nr:SMP-30/gluconolactonase/LRE family protein [Sulfuricaulis sp.]